MDRQRIESLRSFYKENLFDKCLNHWLEKSIDNDYGGYITCLDRKWEVFNTDKSVWFQGRGAWMFSKIYNTLEKDAKWLEAAEKGYDFLLKHCFDTDGRMFFQVTREGKPLRKRRYVFSEAFAAIAFAEYYMATGKAAALEHAKRCYKIMVDVYRGAMVTEPKVIPETREMKGLSFPMILLNVTQIMREAEKDPLYDEVADQVVNDIFNDFYKSEEKALFECVGVNGERLDSPQGRCINPGHSIEAAWFLLHEGMYREDKQIIDKALLILEQSIEIGWDKEHGGGILYFVDIEGKPAEQYEWDMKLWWPHTEALYAFLLAYHLTGDSKYEKWYEKIHEWSFSHFEDSENGEWFGYLHRDGSVSNTLKGSMWKGMFHLPRALLMNYCLLDKMLEKTM